MSTLVTEATESVPILIMSEKEKCTCCFLTWH